MEKTFSIPMSRRNFMKLMGLTTGTLLVSGAGTAKTEAASASTPSLNFENANLPVLFHTDVCVVGGGSAGTAAAVTVARKGAKVVLVERGISLGGPANQGCVFPCMPTFVEGSDTPYITELNKRMDHQGASTSLGIDTDSYYGGDRGQYVPEYLSLVHDEMCAEAGVDILYNASLVGAVTRNNKITACVVQTVEEPAKIEVKVFIDGTWDALLSRFAGMPTEKGSENTGRNQPMSLRFEMAGMSDLEQMRDNIATMREYEPLTNEEKEVVRKCSCICRKNGSAGTADFSEYDDIKPKGISAAAILETWNNCTIQPVPSFAAEHNYFTTEKAKHHIPMNESCLPEKIIGKNGTDVTVMAREAEKFLMENSFFKYEV